MKDAKRIFMRYFSLLFIFITTTLMAQTQKLTPLSNYKLRNNVKYNDIWGYTDSKGREYALLGVRNGTSIIQILDDGSLKPISFISSNESVWKDIKTYKHYAYVVNESGGGMQILDLSELPKQVTIAATYTQFQTSHNIYIDEERSLLFAEGNHSQPVRLLSLADPLRPEQLTNFGVECHDIFARNGKVYVSEGGHGTIGIYDYNDPRNVKLLKRHQIKNAGYVHNAWPTDDGKYLMTTEENTGKTMKMFDIRDLDNIVLEDEVLAPGRLAHNTHIKGNYAYVSHYGSGLRIYDIGDPKNIREAAFWQKGEKAQAGFVSNWGAFPFFKSGKIIISDIETGLYVFNFAPSRESL